MTELIEHLLREEAQAAAEHELCTAFTAANPQPVGTRSRAEWCDRLGAFIEGNLPAATDRLFAECKARYASYFRPSRTLISCDREQHFMLSPDTVSA
jgi:hypothetical protein